MSARSRWQTPDLDDVFLSLTGDDLTEQKVAHR